MDAFYLVITALVVVMSSAGDMRKTQVMSVETREEGCVVADISGIEFCITSEGENIIMDATGRLPQGAICLAQKDGKSVEMFCQRTGFIEESQTGNGLQREKRAGPFESVGTLAGTLIGGAFGPVGAAVGAFIGGIFGSLFDCIFFCHDDSPPPNTAPYFTSEGSIETKYKVQANRIVFEADEGKTTVHVAWTAPTAYDNEDGNIKVRTQPDTYSYKSSYDLGEGSYNIYFTARDRQGVAEIKSFEFEVKVLRCDSPTWPENGKLFCASRDHIWGTSCYVTCKEGYNIDKNHQNPIRCKLNELNETGVSWSSPTPDCKPTKCKGTPTVPHGGLRCISGGRSPTYESVCGIVCQDGFRPDGFGTVQCDENGEWGNIPKCVDYQPPEFLSGECPRDRQVFMDSADGTAVVTWDIPEGEDNSGEDPIITQTSGKALGERFAVGTHSIKYTIKDKQGNRGDSCMFSITVLSLSCAAPNLNVSGKEHLRYDCPSYTLGSNCTLSCRPGYPFFGSNQITCARVTNTGSHDVRWKLLGLYEPFCQVSTCNESVLQTPSNGALSCSTWVFGGKMCAMQCQKGYDIPNIGDGQYTCATSSGKWNPNARVPDCNVKMNADRLHLPSEFYYYTGDCQNSTRTSQQIKENFVQALTTSKYSFPCAGVPECRAEFTDVTCGSTAKRRRRNVEKRASGELAYIVTFELIISIPNTPGKSESDLFDIGEDMLYKMSDIMQKETDSGIFDFHIPGLTVKSDSLAAGMVNYKCPFGTMPKQATASCVGCPRGQYFSSDTDRCIFCPVGTFQDTENSVMCKDCPVGTSTPEDGSISSSQCLSKCAPGQFSFTGLSPCSNCSVGFYQSRENASKCFPCGTGLRTLAEGSKSQSECRDFDLHLQTNQPIAISSNRTVDTITLRMWIFIEDVNKVTTVSLRKSNENFDISLGFGNPLTLSSTGSDLHRSTRLTNSTWTHIALVLDKITSEAVLYVSGKQTYINQSFSMPRGHLLDINDTLLVSGDIQISRFFIESRKLLGHEIMSLATTCQTNSSNVLFGMDSLTMSGNLKILVPSMCDAIDECLSSPCGMHICVNRLDSYECKCKDGYSGAQCQTPPDFCLQNNCKNGASCITTPTNYTCHCVNGFKGEFCESEIVDGNWSPWSEWTKCSTSCGGGNITRSRACSNPSPDPDGKVCEGVALEAETCNTQKCPECVKLRRSFGTSLNCTKSGDLELCTVSCRTGLYFSSPPLPFYQCGAATGYIWSHQTEDNPGAKLPSCSDMQPPTRLEANIDGHYDNIACTDVNVNTIKAVLDSKLSNLECKKAGACEASVKGTECGTSRRKRDVTNKLTVTVYIGADVQLSGSGLNVQDVLNNKSAPSSDLVQLLKQIAELEKTAQNIFNNSLDFFQVVMDGSKRTVSPGGVAITTDVSCPAGTIRKEVFCVESPAGSYSDGKRVILCPKGQYQEETGQISCTKCPVGTTTVGVGSILLSECSELDNKDTDNHWQGNNSDESSDAIKIGVGVSVTITLLVIAVTLIVVAYKMYNKRKRQVGESFADLHMGNNIMPGRPVYQHSRLNVETSRYHFHSTCYYLIFGQR